MQFASATFKSILFICGVIGACQSVVWIFLSVCAILTFRGNFGTLQYATDHVVLTTIYKFYFEGDGHKVEGNPPGYPDLSEVDLIKPVGVFSWMIAFTVISTIHLISSVFLVKQSRREPGRAVLREWCFIAFVIAVMDVSLAGIFVSDYVALKDYLRRTCNDDEEGIVAAPVAMAIVAARGVALWLVNAAFLIYFGLWLSSTSLTEAKSTDTAREAEEERKRGSDNRAFGTVSEPSTFWDIVQADVDRGEASARVSTHRPVTLSVSSFEGVTSFIEEKQPETYRGMVEEKGKFACNCRKLADGRLGMVATAGRNTIYHSHGCPALRLELEEKLATIRGAQERAIPSAKKLADFSHDIRNFKSGGGQIPKAPPLPAALTSNNSSFY